MEFFVKFSTISTLGAFNTTNTSVNFYELSIKYTNFQYDSLGFIVPIHCLVHNILSFNIFVRTHRSLGMVLCKNINGHTHDRRLPNVYFFKQSKYFK
jgi:hypothetical protein